MVRARVVAANRRAFDVRAADEVDDHRESREGELYMR